ncbi:MAG: hypothetical protein WDW38_010133 [Sanguina aurantia]
MLALDLKLLQETGGPLSSIVFHALFMNATRDGSSTLTHLQFLAAVSAISRHVGMDVGLLVAQMGPRESPEPPLKPGLSVFSVIAASGMRTLASSPLVPSSLRTYGLTKSSEFRPSESQLSSNRSQQTVPSSPALKYRHSAGQVSSSAPAPDVTARTPAPPTVAWPGASLTRLNPCPEAHISPRLGRGGRREHDTSPARARSATSSTSHDPGLLRKPPAARLGFAPARTPTPVAVSCLELRFHSWRRRAIPFRQPPQLPLELAAAAAAQSTAAAALRSHPARAPRRCCESDGLGDMPHRGSSSPSSSSSSSSSAELASSTCGCIPTIPTTPPLSAGIPGEPAGLVLISKRYGRLTLQQSLAPAIRLARDGFQPDPRLRGAIAEQQSDLQRWPASAAKFLPNGKPPVEGAAWRDPDQARTLELIASKGNDGFYHGETAARLIAAVHAAGGRWTLADLAGYEAKERKPIEVNYRGYRIVTAPPPSSGGVAIAEILNILSGFDLTTLDQAHRVHLVVEAMRRAFRDHNDYLGDPDFVTMPLQMLLSPFYADGLRQGILPDKATPSSMLPAAEASQPGMHTTHFSIIDAEGNMVGITSTVNYVLGSTFVASGTGVLLNDEMDDFALVPNKPNVYGLLGSVANAPKGGKRPLSSMSPSIVIGADRTAVIGSPGGSTIITQVLEGILHFIDGQSAQQIVAAKRYHHQYMPDEVDVESGTFDAATSDALTGMGYALKERETWGFMNVVTWDRKTNKLDAASDPRHPSGLGKVQ